VQFTTISGLGRPSSAFPKKFLGRGVIAPFPRFELFKSPFPEFAFRSGRESALIKQALMKIPA
jgi:hypothetical protein